jgi:hypothetical protein
MIRTRLSRHWTRGITDGERLIRSFRILTMWTWIDRFNDWHVARFGGAVDAPVTWWVRPISRFVCWCDDWRTTLAQRKPYKVPQRRVDPEDPT